MGLVALSNPHLLIQLFLLFLLIWLWIMTKFIPEPLLKVTVTFPIFSNFDNKAYLCKMKHTAAQQFHNGIPENSWMNEWVNECCQDPVSSLLLYSIVLKVFQQSFNIRLSLSFTFSKISQTWENFFYTGQQHRELSAMDISSSAHSVTNW